MPIRNWSTTAADNDDAEPLINWAEGQAPSTVNNSARQMMADLRSQHEEAEWIDLGHTLAMATSTKFTVGSADRKATYAVGRRVRATSKDGGSSAVIYGTVTDVTFSADTAVTVGTWDSGSLSTTLSLVAVGIISPPGNDVMPTPILAGDGTVGAPGFAFRDDTDNGAYRIGANNFGIAVAGALAMEFDPIGAIQQPLQPAFLARATTQSNMTGDTTIQFDTEIFDQNADFDAVTNYNFTAPVAGKYLFSASVHVNNIDTACTAVRIDLVTSNRTYEGSGLAPSTVINADTSNMVFHVSAVADMDAGDTAEIQWIQAAGNVQADTSGAVCHFSGCLLT